jgi:hypothetical protein
LGEALSDRGSGGIPSSPVPDPVTFPSSNKRISDADQHVSFVLLLKRLSRNDDLTTLIGAGRSAAKSSY